MRLILAVAALICTSPSWAVQDPSPESGRPAAGEAELIPLGRTRLGHYTISLRLDQPVSLAPSGETRRAIPLVLDTAASHTALRLPVATQLNTGAPFQFDQVAHSTTGAFLTDTFVLRDADFGAGPRDILSIVLPDADSAAASTQGFLGSSAFMGERVEIDFTRSRLIVDPDLRVTRHLDFDPRRRIVTGYATMRGVDQPVRILIDTGSNASLANSALARRRPGPDAHAQMSVEGVDDGTRAQSERRRLFGGLEVGGLCFPMFWATVLDVHAFDNLGWSDEPAMLIGLDILDDARLKIDYQTGAVEIEGVTDTACGRTN